MAADRALWDAADARPSRGIRARTSPRHAMVGLDPVHVSADTIGHRRKPAPQSGQETARPILPQPAGTPSVAVTPPDLNRVARRVIDANHYMTLGTLDPDGAPRLSPVFYTAARYTDFYWLSSPDAHQFAQRGRAPRGPDRHLRLHRGRRRGRGGLPLGDRESDTRRRARGSVPRGVQDDGGSTPVRARRVTRR